MESCAKHPHERGVGLCQRCGWSWCSDCLVHVLGPKKPPMCVECAMFAGGVRSSASRPAMPKRELKARLKALSSERAAAAEEATPSEGPEPQSQAAAASTTSTVASDWATPWWEDREPALAD
jgi:hypothetical protein